MINLTKEQIKEIAELLDSGMRCFINYESGEIRSHLNFDRWQTDDQEPWQDILNELDANWDKYVEISAMETYESFKVMADFVESIDNNDLRNNLITALNRKHPFQNFKWVIDNSGEYRQKWFDYKNQRSIEWVQDQLSILDFDNGNE